MSRRHFADAWWSADSTLLPAARAVRYRSANLIASSCRSETVGGCASSHSRYRFSAASCCCQAYYEWLRAKAVVAVAEESYAAAAATLHDAETGVDAGVLTTGDVARWRARLAKADAELIGARYGETNRAYVLSVLIGRPGASLRVGSDIFAAPPAPALEPIARLAERASAARADVRALEADARRLDAASRGAATDFFPQLIAVAQATYANPNPRAIPPREEFRASWFVGGALTWSPNRLLTNRARVRELKARRRELVASAASMRRAVAIEVSMAYSAREASTRAVSLLRRQVAAANEAYAVASDRYRVGDATASEVVEAQASQARARLAEVFARIDAHAAAARLRYASGETD